MFNRFDCKLAIGTYSLTNITAPQDAHKRLVLQVYLGSNSLEFSAIQLAMVSINPKFIGELLNSSANK